MNLEGSIQQLVHNCLVFALLGDEFSQPKHDLDAVGPPENTDTSTLELGLIRSYNISN